MPRHRPKVKPPNLEQRSRAKIMQQTKAREKSKIIRLMGAGLVREETRAREKR